MNINIEIRSIKQWYRNSTKEWIIDVNFIANNVGGNIRYSNKKLNKVKKSMIRNLYKDILEDEIEYLFKNNMLKIEE